MSNYRSKYPEEFRWGKWPEGYCTNYPGTTYLDTQASDNSNLENWTVGTLDGPFFASYRWYHTTIVGTPAAPGPNWYQVRIEAGVMDNDAWRVFGGPAWAMTRPDEHAPTDGRHIAIPLTNRFTFPNQVAIWSGPVSP